MKRTWARTTRGGTATGLALAWLVLIAPGAAKASGTFDVTSAPYSANTTGATNDRTAIQNAINDANAAGGGTVLLPGGTSGSPKIYLSGNLVLKSNVTLQINQYATLRQSQTPSDYSYTPGLGKVVNTTFQYNYYFYKNLPFVYAGLGTTNVGVIGQAAGQQGVIELTLASGGVNSTIHESAVGFFGVGGTTGGTIQNIHVIGERAPAFQIMQTSKSLVNGTTVDQIGGLNAGAIEIDDAQNVTVTSNTFGSSASPLDDDGILIGSAGGTSSNYPWCSTGYWCAGFTPQLTSNVEIGNNTVVTSAGTKAIAWSPWGAGDSRAGITAINVHNNSLSSSSTGDAVGCWCTDPYPISGSHSESWNVTFASNTYPAGAKDISAAAIHDLNINPANDSLTGTEPSTLSNTGFETGNLSDWSSSGVSGQYGVSNVADGQSGTWEGYIKSYNLGYTSIWQGVSLAASTSFTLNLNGKTDGTPARLYVYDTCTGSNIATQSFSNTSWQTLSLTFTTPATACRNFEVGVDNPGQTSASAWAHVDQASFGTPALNFGNPGFESGSLTPWLGQGISSQYGTSNAADGQTGTWEGTLQNYNLGYTSIWQPFALAPSTAYTVHLDTKTDGSVTRLYVWNTCTSTTSASLSYSNSTWQTKTLSFTTGATPCSEFDIGIDNSGNSSSSAWSRMDQANLTSP
jgi:polygalacturonase